jgi:hypothetical protein
VSHAKAPRHKKLIISFAILHWILVIFPASGFGKRIFGGRLSPLKNQAGMRI